MLGRPKKYDKNICNLTRPRAYLDNDTDNGDYHYNDVYTEGLTSADELYVLQSVDGLRTRSVLALVSLLMRKESLNSGHK